MANKRPRANPYVGPRAFEIGETLYGRDQDILSLYYLLLSERIVLLFSPSGAGKSSLVQAGLIPKLKEKFQILPIVRVNQEPPEELAHQDNFNRYIYSVMISMEEGLPEGERNPAAPLAHLTLQEYLARRKAPEPPQPRIGDLDEEESRPTYEVLIFDQFEEILTVAPNDFAAKQTFFEQVGEALHDPKRWALFIAREDFVASFEPFLRWIPTRLANRSRLDFLEASLALEAIQKPAQDEGVDFTDAAARKLVDDLREVQIQRPDGSMATEPGRYVEPVQLQVVCRRLWQKLSSRKIKITEQLITSSGDVNESLAAYFAEQVCAAEDEFGVSQRLIRDWFGKSLITPQGLRSQVLRESRQSAGLDNSVIEFLESAHLIRGEKRRGATWYELTHDRLVRPIIEDNASWFAENLSPLQRRAALWIDQGKDEGLLLTDLALLALEEWAGAHPGDLSNVENQYLTACRAKQAQAQEESDRQAQQQKLETAEKVAEEQARSARRARQFSILAATLLLIAIVASTRAIFQRGEAVKARSTSEVASTQAVAQRSTAEAASTLAVRESTLATQQEWLAFASQLAVQAQFVGASDNQLGLLLAIESLNQAQRAGASHFPTAENVLQGAVEQVGAGTPLYGHTAPVNTLAISPEGRWLATGSSDNNVLLWDLTAQNPAARPVTLSAHADSIYALAFSPDGRWLASAGADATVILWNMTAQEPGATPIRLAEHADWIRALAFSPDGHWLASAGDDETVMLWDMTARDPGANPIRLAGHEDWIRALAFGLDGHWLASAGDDATVMLWDMTAQNPAAEPIRLTEHQVAIYELAFSPDGRWLASAGADSTVILWDMAARDPATEPVILDEHTDQVYALAFSPDGRVLASGGADATVILWDMTTLIPTTLSGYTSSINSLAFSPNGQQLATGSTDATVRLWNVSATNQFTSTVLSGEEGSINTLAFSPDGNTLVGAGDSPTPRLWQLSVQSESGLEDRISEYEVLTSLRGHMGEVTGLAFSPDDGWLASSGEDGTVRVWNFQAGTPTEADLVLRGDVGNVTALIFQDRDFLVGGTENRTLLAWDLSTDPPSEQRFEFDGNTSILAADPDFQLLAIPSDDDAVQVWSDESTHQDLRGHTGIVLTLAFSPDGRWLASGSADSTIRLWDLQADSPSAQTKVLRGHEGSVLRLTFSPDGQWLASAGEDGTVRIWDFRKDRLAAAAFVLDEDQGPVQALAFSPGGRWLASGGNDGRVLLWDVSSSDPSARSIALRAPGTAIAVLAFSPSGRWLAAGGSDGEVELWGVGGDYLKRQACIVAARNLSWKEWTAYLQEIYDGQTFHKTCPDYPIDISVAEHFLEVGDQLASSGDAQGALSSYNEAVSKVPEILELVPDLRKRANGQAVQALLEEGDVLAGKIDIEGAVAKYTAARALDANVDLSLESSGGDEPGDPRSRAERLAVFKLIDDFYANLYANKIEDAVANLSQARELDANAAETIGASTWNELCWQGSVRGFARVVKDACEKAVELDPENGGNIDSRGLNRALLGDYAGAISDFEIAIQWMNENGYEEFYITEREAWIKELGDGMDPFDEATLEHLKDE